MKARGQTMTPYLIFVGEVIATDSSGSWGGVSIGQVWGGSS